MMPKQLQETEKFCYMLIKVFRKEAIYPFHQLQHGLREQIIDTGHDFLCGRDHIKQYKIWIFNQI